MIHISEEAKQSFRDRVNIRLVLEFDDNTVLSNDDIVSNTFTLEQSICEEEQLKYGSICAAKFSIKTSKSSVSYKGKSVEITMTSGENDEYSVPLGKFVVDEDTKSDDGKFRTLVGYDAMYYAMETEIDYWYDHLVFPMTLKQFRDSLFTFLDIEQETVELVNDSLVVQKSVEASQGAKFALRTILQAICEINGALGMMTQTNKFRYVTPDSFGDFLLPADDLYPDDDLYPKDGEIEGISAIGEHSTIKQGSFIYKDYYVHPITRVVIQENDDDDGTYYGEGDNAYKVVGNFLTFGLDNDDKVEVAQNMYSILNNVVYTPTRVTMLANPWLEAGDYIHIQGYSTASIIPILSRTMSGITNATDTYIANGTEYTLSESSGTNYQLRQLRSKTMRIETNVDRIETEMTAKFEDVDGDISDLSSRITQTSESITAEVTRAQGSENALSSRITQNATNIESKVSKGSVISSINQSAESVSINASKINLNGAVTANNNVTIGVDGKITAIDGSFSGSITTTNLITEPDTHQYRIKMGNAATGNTSSFMQIASDDGYTGTNVYIIEFANAQHYNTDPQSVKYAPVIRFRPYYSDTIQYVGALEISAQGRIVGKGNNSHPTQIADPDLLLDYTGTIKGASLTITGNKSRVVDTINYDKRLLYCLESPTPMFEDIGEAKLDSTGKCVIFIDDIFSETVDRYAQYQVFLQKYGNGDCWVSERNPLYFVVEGTENLSFGWRLVAIQKDFIEKRLDDYTFENNVEIDDTALFSTLDYVEELVDVDI